MLIRRLDDIPSSNEQSQYRQSIFQLYNQMSVLHRQTKQSFTLFNTLTDTISYINRELNILDSINSIFAE